MEFKKVQIVLVLVLLFSINVFAALNADSYFSVDSTSALSTDFIFTGVIFENLNTDPSEPSFSCKVCMGKTISECEAIWSDEVIINSEDVYLFTGSFDPDHSAGTQTYYSKVQCSSTDPINTDTYENTLNFTANITQDLPLFSFDPVSTNATVNLGNNYSVGYYVYSNDDTTLTCSYQLDSSQAVSLGTLIPGGNQSFTVLVTGNSIGNQINNVAVTCSSIDKGSSASKNATINLTVNEDPSAIAAAINSANTMINEASTVINQADQRIQEVVNIGADATKAKNKLDEAKNYLTSAQSQLNNATTSGQANAAYNNALSAKTAAVAALTEADKSLETKLDAERKTNSLTMLTEFEAIIADMSLSITNSEALIKAGESLGINLNSEKRKIEGLKIVLEGLENELSDMKSMYDKSDFSSIENIYHGGLTVNANNEKTAAIAESLKQEISNAKIISDDIKTAKEKIVQAENLYNDLVAQMNESDLSSEQLTTLRQKIERTKVDGIDAIKTALEEAEQKLYNRDYGVLSSGMTAASLISSANDSQNILLSLKEELALMKENPVTPATGLVTGVLDDNILLYGGGVLAALIVLGAGYFIFTRKK